jgi:hypothetical protein
MSSRPLTELSLKVSKTKASIVTYLTRSERVSIEKAKYKGASFNYDVKGGSKSTMAADFTINEDQELLAQGVKRLVGVDGIAIENPTIDQIGELPDQDAQIILDELKKVSNANELAKKK